MEGGDAIKHSCFASRHVSRAKIAQIQKSVSRAEIVAGHLTFFRLSQIRDVRPAAVLQSAACGAVRAGPRGRVPFHHPLVPRGDHHPTAGGLPPGHGRPRQGLSCLIGFFFVWFVGLFICCVFFISPCGQRIRCNFLLSVFNGFLI